MIGMDDQAFMGDVEVLHNWWDGDAQESCDVLVGCGYDRTKLDDQWNLRKLQNEDDVNALQDVPMERLHTPSSTSTVMCDAEWHHHIHHRHHDPSSS